MKIVIIEMDQCFTWWPREVEPDDNLEGLEAIHLSEEFLVGFRQAQKQYLEYQDELEKLFRAQQKLKPR